MLVCVRAWVRAAIRFGNNLRVNIDEKWRNCIKGTISHVGTSAGTRQRQRQRQRPARKGHGNVALPDDAKLVVYTAKTRQSVCAYVCAGVCTCVRACMCLPLCMGHLLLDLAKALRSP